MIPLGKPAQRARSVVWRHAGGRLLGERMLAEEIPIAFAYGGCTYAVMMATPDDLADFAYGFSLTEGLISSPAEVEELRIRQAEGGLVLDMTLAPERMDAFWERRRYLAGPAGCGLCGIDSIAQALRACPTVAADLRLTPAEIAESVALLPRQQPLNGETRSVHAAGFWRKRAGIIAVREDIGRHNALDKLVGALARQGGRMSAGAVLLTSRISVELVQKAAAAGVPVMVAVSAPSGLAVRTAEASGITLIGVARGDGFEVLSQPRRIEMPDAERAA